MTWIRVDTTLLRHPKVARFAKSLGMNRHEAVGILIDLWTWSVDFTEGGDLSRISSDDLMAALGVTQDTALVKFDFIESLVTAGFIDREGERIVLHDWDIHQGQLLAQRDANRERQRRHRRKRGGNRYATVTTPLPSRDEALGNAATKRTRNVHVTERRESASLLAFDDLLPVTSVHVDRWRPLFPNLDIAVELEAMHAYLVAAPANRRPKRSLAKFAINWLKRSAKERAVDQRGDLRERAVERRHLEGAAQVKEIGSTAPLSREALDAAKVKLGKLFAPRTTTEGNHAETG
jgi:hypothetical protein